MKRTFDSDTRDNRRIRQAYPQTCELFQFCAENPTFWDADKLLAMYQELGSFISTESDDRAEHMAGRIVDRFRRGIPAHNTVDTYINHIVYLEREKSARATTQGWRARP